MKKIILVPLLVSFVVLAKAQSGLQFSQVVLTNSTLGNSIGNTASVGTVPAGKVWKIENILSDNGMSSIGFKLNAGATLQIPYYSGSTAWSNMMSNQSPIWLPEGTVVSLYRINTATSSQTIYFSIIEFNVVP